MANKIKISGTIVEKPVFSHEIFGRKFYEFYISSERLSGTTDRICCLVAENIVNEILENEMICLWGEIRTRNSKAVGEKKLKVYIHVTSTSEYPGYDENAVRLNGFTCKEPTFRELLGQRYISDLIVASNRRFGYGTDYIPCILWGNAAKKIYGLEIGSELELTGRLQSREYIKNFDDGTEATMTAYELSVGECGVSIIQGKEDEDVGC